MKTHFFTIYLDRQPTLDEVEVLYGAFDDGLSVSRNDDHFIGFDREADSLETAIASAIDDVRNCGFEVIRIEIDLEEFDAAAS